MFESNIFHTPLTDEPELTESNVGCEMRDLGLLILIELGYSRSTLINSDQRYPIAARNCFNEENFR
jgi:hypothetical protein